MKRNSKINIFKTKESVCLKRSNSGKEYHIEYMHNSIIPEILQKNIEPMPTIGEKVFILIAETIGLRIESESK
jgi:hypothetical protein